MVSSRSFGQLSDVGPKLLSDAGFEIWRVPPEERPLDEAKMVEIVAREAPTVIVTGAEPVSRLVMEASPNLAMIMKHGVGIDNIDIPAATELGILVANAPGTNTEAVADMTIAMMLALLRRVYEAVQSTKSGGWERYVGHDLGALKVGIVGTGKIGLAVIKRLMAFGSEVLAYDIVHNPDLIEYADVRYVKLEELLRESDIVSLHVPLVAATKSMIGSKELAMMKSTAFLVNMARGELVDEEALLVHLKENRIAGAAVDVYAVEPPRSSPLIGLDNVLSTPHIAAYTHESMERMGRICAQTILDGMQSIECSNILNPEVMTQKDPS
ncbi:MAG TPA: phosphoglycerate dehydrogenase [Anaerolineae bacterium]|nr:phosphoglycerate dehydrogenase [Anaerolineae bacterium]